MSKSKTIDSLRDKRHFSVSATEKEIERINKKLSGDKKLSNLDLAFLNGARFSLRWILGQRPQNTGKTLDWWIECEELFEDFSRKVIMTNRDAK